MSAKKAANPAAQVLGDDPFEGEQLLLDAIFGDDDASAGERRSTRAVRRLADVSARETLAGAAATAAAPDAAGKPEHYKVVSISLYLEDIERLDAYVRELKRRGHYKANKSQIIRQALLQLDLDRISNER